jgi:hypothetical protein
VLLLVVNGIVDVDVVPAVVLVVLVALDVVVAVITPVTGGIVVVADVAAVFGAAVVLDCNIDDLAADVANAACC